MPVALEHIREHLLPGLWQISASPATMATFESVFVAAEAPCLLPAVSLSVALPLAAAAVIAKNPEVTRRNLLFGASS